MLRFRSISIRIMVSIALVAAGSCALLAGFGMWRQQTTVDTALERELRSDYANFIAAMDSETRATLAVANTLAVMPQLKDLVRAADRPGILDLLQGVLAKIAPMGLELITIQTPPASVLARAHNPKVFGDDISVRRKLVVQAMTTKKPVGGVEAGLEVLNVFGSAPILDGDTVIGNVDIGAPFGEIFVKTMKARFGVDVAIHQIRDNAVKTLATTAPSSAPSVDAVKRALAGETLISQDEQAGHHVAFTFGPIKSFSGEPIAVVEIVRDATAYSELKQRSALWLALGAITAIILSGLIAIWLGRGLARPIRSLEGAMRDIAAGNHDTAVPGANRGDEIGSMAAAVKIFKDGLIETGQLRTAQENQRVTSEAERRGAIHALAERFEASVGGVVNAVGDAATELRATAVSMAGTAEQATQQTTTVAAASEEASRNSQAVAAAIEELNASISEIAQQVNESAKVAGQAAGQANKTTTEVRGLAQAAEKIGDVVKLISEIAAQTNLLALNATIEAARAGDAGRGFAVVASEVKTLASQTSKATEEISAQVAAIQSATLSSVEAIDGITHTIGRVNEIASAIASAVEEQGAATREISYNVAEAARGTGEVSENINGVRNAARETGAAADQVVASAAALSEGGETLKMQVEAFLREVRAA
ncbi:MAG: HAMP domain-containing protein [Xanthobacteraceae bacterium]|nr:HAMP domain-containing protein [Xanthobacteraceae bacterium]